jgi:hypothetical protein
MRLLIASTAVALGLVLGSPSDAAAQSYAQQVWNQLQRVYSVANASEYRLRNYIVGHLNSGNSDSWTFPLTANTEYLVTGACDNDCSDLDIFIKDANGNTIAQDTSTDDIPMVRFTTRAAGRYTVDVRMYQCSVNPCYFGFGIFHK